MLAIMWYSILELFYSPFVLQLLHISSPGETSGTNSLEISPSVRVETGVVNLTRPCPEFDETTSVRLFFYADPPDPAKRGCHELRSKTPCGENMRFYQVNDTIGECDCDDLLDTPNTFRSLIYDRKRNKCHPIFTQGYCEQGMWLDFTRDSPPVPVCVQNPCYKETTSEKDMVIVASNGTCEEVGSTCGPGQIIGFDDGVRLAQCVPRRMLLRAIPPPKVKCKPGTYRASNGRCQPAFAVFD